MKADELTVVITQVGTQVDNMRRELNNMVQAHERLRDKYEEVNKQLAETVRDLRNHIAHVEKWDVRRWTTIGFFVAGLITLVANLILLFVKGK